MQLEDLPGIAEIETADDVSIDDLALDGKPVVLRGIARHWPIVLAAESGAADLASVVAKLDSGAPADIMVGQPEIGGRFFYNDALNGFNFDRSKGRLGDIMREIVNFAGQESPPAIYAGATATATHAPGFDTQHRLPQGLTGAGGQSRLWIGNRVDVATHFDMSPNLAIVAAGQRRFSLFAPAATPHLYVGPLHNTIAGQPVSMVDPREPDLARYPEFAKAWPHASTAVLSPGDAIYIPALWWHHVSALSDINVLVNYWHHDAEHGGPFLAFIHALWSIRDLPEPHRESWRHWFDHFVFGEDAASLADHLPPSARMVNGPPNPERDKAIHGFLLQVLSGQ